MGIPLYVMSCFSLAAFKMLSLIFDTLIVMYLGLIVSLELSGLPGSECSWLRLGTLSVIISSNKFLAYFSFLSETPKMWILVSLMMSHKSLKLSSFTIFAFFLLFLLFGWIPLHCLWIRWSFLLLHLICCWTHFLVFFSSDVSFSSVTCICFSVVLSLVKFSLYSSLKFSEQIYDPLVASLPKSFDHWVESTSKIIFLMWFSTLPIWQCMKKAKGRSFLSYCILGPNLTK